MSEAETNSELSESARLPQSEVPAQSLLSRLLDLLGDARTLADITFERVSDAMGLPFQTLDTGGWGYAARLSPDWTFDLRFSPEREDGSLLDFAFHPEATADGPHSDVGYLDFDAVSTTLRASGYVLQTSEGESPEELFARNDIQLLVEAHGESDGPIEHSRHRYVQRLAILASQEQ